MLAVISPIAQGLYRRKLLNNSIIIMSYVNYCRRCYNVVLIRSQTGHKVVQMREQVAKLVCWSYCILVKICIIIAETFSSEIAQVSRPRDISSNKKITRSKLFSRLMPEQRHRQHTYSINSYSLQSIIYKNE